MRRTARRRGAPESKLGDFRKYRQKLPRPRSKSAEERSWRLPPPEQIGRSYRHGATLPPPHSVIETYRSVRFESAISTSLQSRNPSNHSCSALSFYKSHVPVCCTLHFLPHIYIYIYISFRCSQNCHSSRAAIGADGDCARRTRAPVGGRRRVWALALIDVGALAVDLDDADLRGLPCC